VSPLEFPRLEMAAIWGRALTILVFAFPAPKFRFQSLPNSPRLSLFANVIVLPPGVLMGSARGREIPAMCRRGGQALRKGAESWTGVRWTACGGEHTPDRQMNRFEAKGLQTPGPGSINRPEWDQTHNRRSTVEGKAPAAGDSWKCGEKTIHLEGPVPWRGRG
jgi:hypothetical protein